MAHVIETSHGSVQSSIQERQQLSTGGFVGNDAPAAYEDIPVRRKYFGLAAAPAVTIAVVLLAVLVAIGAYFAWFNSSSTTSTAANGTSAPSPSAGAPSTAAAAASPVTLSAADIKEMKGRDDYATNLSKFLHAKFPAYKNVKIYADSWAGTRAPARTPLADIKSRKGDNLMLVFWSPEAGTARGLGDFTKSQGAQEAVNAGFAEFQFVDPDTYCYATVVPVTGVGGVVCGIR